MIEKLYKYKNKLIKLKEENIKLKQENFELKKIAYNDELTNLSNRRVITNIKDEFNAVIMCDIDWFKKINDTYGHNKGDEVLKDIAKILNENIRENDIAIRWGGEEFLLLLKNCSIDNALFKANNIREQVEINKSDINVTMSFGISEKTIDKGLEQAIIEADKALYQSKENGRNQVTRYINQKIKIKEF